MYRLFCLFNILAASQIFIDLGLHGSDYKAGTQFYRAYCAIFNELRGLGSSFGWTAAR